jgi:hypothetical protein
MMLWTVALLACKTEPVEIKPVIEPTDVEPSTGDTSERPTTDPTEGVTATIDDESVTAVDIAIESGYVDTFFGLQRGRTAVAADFDRDGDLDVFSGNPGDTSYILMNRTDGTGVARFEPGQILVEGPVAYWGGSANDADNDGDIDLYVTEGGNELPFPGLDHLYLNDGTGRFTDVSAESNIWLTDKAGAPFPTHHGGAVWWDMNLDARLDLFVNGVVLPATDVGKLSPADPTGRNGWLLSGPDGTYEPLFFEGQERFSTYHSSPIDFDNDGDIDLFENNNVGPSFLWKNLLKETGQLQFVDVTFPMSLGGSDMHYPMRTPWSSAAWDFNQDGWEDLIVFRRGDREPSEPVNHSDGHVMWINVQGQGFVEVGNHTGLNDFVIPRDHLEYGVMGGAIGDIDADGYPEIFSGNGAPVAGERDIMMWSTGVEPMDIGGYRVLVPKYVDGTALIDVPSPAESPDARYPYRTHGSFIADLDGDGLLELAVHNGGPADADRTQEPNRLFKFSFNEPKTWLRLALVGDGVAMSADALGARVRARVTDANGQSRWVYGTRRSNTAFCAQGEHDVFLGLDGATVVNQVIVNWPGVGDREIPVPPINQRVVVPYAP